MVMIVPILAIISWTWRIVIHLFDPEDVAAPHPSSPPAPVQQRAGPRGSRPSSAREPSRTCRREGLAEVRLASVAERSPPDRRAACPRSPRLLA